MPAPQSRPTAWDSELVGGGATAFSHVSSGFSAARVSSALLLKSLVSQAGKENERRGKVRKESARPRLTKANGDNLHLSCLSCWEGAEELLGERRGGSLGPGVWLYCAPYRSPRRMQPGGTRPPVAALWRAGGSVGRTPHSHVLLEHVQHPEQVNIGCHWPRLFWALFLL